MFCAKIREIVALVVMKHHESANIIGTETAPEFHPRNLLESQPSCFFGEFMALLHSLKLTVRT